MPFYKALYVDIKVICNTKLGLELQGSIDVSLFLLAKDNSAAGCCKGSKDCSASVKTTNP
jgi:hypothetical protein